jgi:hypothetical protein
MIIHEKLIQFYKGFNYDAHPMVKIYKYKKF